MSITIDLSPETEEELRAKAEAQGRDISEVLQELIERTFGPGASAESQPRGGSLFDLLKDRAGRIEGTGEAFSENTGDRFAEHLIEKREKGRL